MRLDEAGPDQGKSRGKLRWIVAIVSDEADSFTADERDTHIYRIRFSRVRAKTTNIREAANEIDEELRDIQNNVEDSVGPVLVTVFPRL